MKKSVVISVVLIIVLLCVIVSAAYLMTSPESDDVTVTPTPSPTPTGQATLSKVAVSTTILTVGSDLTVSTTVSDHTAGLTVVFYNNNDVAIGTNTTNASGTAYLTFQPPIGTWSFYAVANHP